MDVHVSVENGVVSGAHAKWVPNRDARALCIVEVVYEHYDGGRFGKGRQDARRQYTRGGPYGPSTTNRKRPGELLDRGPKCVQCNVGSIGHQRFQQGLDHDITTGKRLRRVEKTMLSCCPKSLPIDIYSISICRFDCFVTLGCLDNYSIICNIFERALTNLGTRFNVVFYAKIIRHLNQAKMSLKLRIARPQRDHHTVALSA